MKEIKEHVWETVDEISFLDKLGEHQKSEFSGFYGLNPQERFERKMKLLEGYLEGCSKRRDWGILDPLMCIDHANMLLRKYEAECTD